MNVDLFGNNNVQVAIDRIKEAYGFSQQLGLGKLYVAFSGGKDSECIYYLCKMASEQLGMDSMDDLGEYYYNVTNIDPPELVQFVKTFKNVQFVYPKKTFWQLAEEHKMFPLIKVRYCCAALKEIGGFGRFNVTGVRWAESARRRKQHGVFDDMNKNKAEKRILNADNDEDRRVLEHCIPKQKYVCNPIVDWTDEDVWSFIKNNGYPYCSLYDKGFKRLGCLMCPMANDSLRERESIMYPTYTRQFIRTAKKIIDARKKAGLELKEYEKETPERFFYWWLHNKTIKPDGTLLKEDDEDTL